MAIADAVVLLDIDFVVLGGGVAEKLGAELVGRVEQAARGRLFGDVAVRVVAAALGDHAGVVGAAAPRADRTLRRRLRPVPHRRTPARSPA